MSVLTTTVMEMTVDTFRREWPPVPAHRVAVVDTNAILSSVAHQARTGKRPRILRSTVLGSTNVLASDHVYDEVYRRAYKLAKPPVTTPQLLQLFETQWLPHISFVTVDMSDLPPIVATVTDPDDQPTAALACLLQRAVVFSDDNDLIRPALAKPRWRETAGHTAHIAEVDAATRSVAVAGTMILTLLGRPMTTQTRGGSKTAPLLAAAAAAAAATYALRTPSARAGARATARQVLEAAGQAHLDRARAVAAVTKALYVEPTTPTSLKGRVVGRLATAGEPLSVAELRESLAADPQRLGHSFTETQLKQVLYGGSEFIENEGAWQLGATRRARAKTVGELGDT